MLTHRCENPRDAARVVVLGAGFIGGAAADALAAVGVAVERLRRTAVDLLAADAGDRLADVLRDDDVLVVAAAEAPCKDGAALERNIRMVNAVAGALRRRPVEHAIYISSDAVYKDSDGLLTETSCAEPGSLHGVMHLARERMLLDDTGVPLGILRPTLVYGAADPHNGYGANRFRRLALEGRDIVLFGEGEERRDHVLVDDLGDLLRRMVLHRSTGVLNGATGTVHSFREIAELVVRHVANPPAIKGSPRSGPMPHNGYRAFDPAESYRAFPDFRYTPLAEGLALTHERAVAAA